MKNELLVFRLKNPRLIGHTSESMLQYGQSSHAFEPLGLHTLVYHDSGRLFTQMHNDAAKVDGYSENGLGK